MNATTNQREGVRSGHGRRTVLLFLITSGLLAMATAAPAMAQNGRGGGGGRGAGGRGHGGEVVVMTCSHHGPGHVCGPACSGGSVGNRAGGYGWPRGPRYGDPSRTGAYGRGWALGWDEGAQRGYRDGLQGRLFCDAPFRALQHRAQPFRKGYRQAYGQAYARAFERGREQRRDRRHRRHARRDRGWSVTWRW